MAKEVREFDEEKVRSCKEDIDTLLVFVSLRVSLSLRGTRLTGFVLRGRSFLSSPFRVSSCCVSFTAARPYGYCCLHSSSHCYTDRRL